MMMMIGLSGFRQSCIHVQPKPPESLNRGSCPLSAHAPGLQRPSDCKMVSIKFVILAIALLVLVEADAVGKHHKKHRPGKKRRPEGDDPATFYYLVRCGRRSSRLASPAEVLGLLLPTMPSD